MIRVLTRPFTILALLMTVSVAGIALAQPPTPSPTEAGTVVDSSDASPTTVRTNRDAKDATNTEAPVEIFPVEDQVSRMCDYACQIRIIRYCCSHWPRPYGCGSVRC